jgi:hypothetical protein
MYTTNDEKPLEEIFENIYKLMDAKPTDFDPKKADSATLFELLGKVLPDYDTERVHASDAKKLFAWYNILLNAGKLTPSEDDKKEEGKEEISAEKPVAQKPAAPKKTAAPKNVAPKASTQAKSAPKRTTTAKKAI